MNVLCRLHRCKPLWCRIARIHLRGTYFSKACLHILLSKCFSFYASAFLSGKPTEYTCLIGLGVGIKHNSVLKEVGPEYTLCVFFLELLVKILFLPLVKRGMVQDNLPSSSHSLNEGRLPSGLIPNQQSVICLPKKNTMQVPLCHPCGPPPTAPSQF